MDIDLSRVKDLRKEKGLTQLQVSELIGISRKNYQNIETGKSLARLDTLVSIADLYGVTTDYILKRSNER